MTTYYGDKIAKYGTVAAPVAGTISVKDNGAKYPFFSLTFTLAAYRVATVDGAASGSYGTTKLMDFVKQSVAFLGCRQNYTAFAEGSALTTGAGNCVHVLGIGTTAASTARDGTLTTTEQNVGNVTSQITNSGGTGTGSKHTGAVVAGVDGTGTAAALYLNWSGTAATSVASSTIDVTGTVTVTGVFCGP